MMAARQKTSKDVSKSYPGTIRIIGGKWRGRRLDVAEGEGLRPTPDRVRETIFNWLRPWLAGARCLDVTAGTGSLCLEALSQGAASAVMVEQAAGPATMLNKNLAILNAENVRVVHSDALKFLQGPAEPFDIVFLDPPFKSDLIAQCAELLEQRGWLKPEALIYIEAPSTVEILPIPATWELIRSKVAGQVGYHLARRNMRDSL